MDAFWGLRAWGMCIITILAFAYTIYSTKNREKLEKVEEKDKFLIRKVYWSCWTLITTIAINVSKPETILSLGKNKLGISEILWVLGVWIGAGCIIYYFIVSNKSIKSIGKDSLEFENAKQNVNATLEEAKAKSLAAYNSIDDVVEYAYFMKPTMYGAESYDYLEIVKNVVNIFVRKQIYLSLAFVCIVNDLQSVGVKDFTKATKLLDDKECFDTISHDDKHLILLPFESDFSDSLIILGIIAEKPFVGLEQYQILGLLELFEEVILAINEE